MILRRRNKDLKYAYYIGCTIPARMNNYDASARQVADALNIELIDLKKAVCCGTVNIKALDIKTWLTLGATNLALAEKENLDLVTLCNGCFSTLKDSKHVLDSNPELKAEINEVIKDLDLEYKGTIEVKHFIEVLYDDLGVDFIKSKIIKPLDLNVAIHYGCHVLRPSDVAQIDDPEDPHVLEELTEITGARPIKWRYQKQCCGGPILGIREDLSIELARNKFIGASEVNADCFITICPFCGVQLDLVQMKVEEKYNEKYNIPVLYYTQLLGLALDLDPEMLGFDLNRVAVDFIEY
ncbi:MAG: CoB--CoM heterodisulfide reductase subunit B [Candidatus Lokiarchaeota archaeon]|nr:CoB--CoM heterodisulfide reductase subunit B [Candidatus Lokiarchaeota archaeon]